MPLTLNELYTQTKHQYHLSMIAGETGIDHIMNWVYVSEDSSTHDFFEGRRTYYHNRDQLSG